MAQANDPTLNTWHRWFRRTNVHIAEYILMLVIMGALLGLVSSLWYSFFGLMYESSLEARELAKVVAGQVASLLVVGPAAFWLYARTSGQEMVQPELSMRRSHTVFLAIWMIGVVLSFVGVAVSVKAATVMSIFGFGPDFGETAVRVILPGLFVLATLGFGLWVVVKHASRKLSMLTGVVLAALLVLLAIASIIMVVVKKDSTIPSTESLCTFSRYLDKECSYSEYLDQQGGSNYNSGSSTGGFENIFMPSSRY